MDWYHIFANSSILALAAAPILLILLRLSNISKGNICLSVYWQRKKRSIPSCYTFRVNIVYKRQLFTGLCFSHFLCYSFILKCVCCLFLLFVFFIFTQDGIPHDQCLLHGWFASYFVNMRSGVNSSSLYFTRKLLCFGNPVHSFLLKQTNEEFTPDLMFTKYEAN